MIARRYMLPGSGEAFIALVAGISLAAVMLGVAALVIVMSVMNGFRAELLDKIVGLNGHAIIQAYGGRLDNWQAVLKQVQATPGVIQASPLIEQPLLTTFNGRVEAILVRGQTAPDIAGLQSKLKAGNLSELTPGWGIRSPSSTPPAAPRHSARCRARFPIGWRRFSRSASTITTTALSSCRSPMRKR
jgi:lipoprotein-releasing system permease protein